ncbi:MAG: DinB family protein [Nocardiopsaceae bacterium]|nr:DinB family protein [Nocardiopsaceae bacterium]
MGEREFKDELHRYLKAERESVLWKLDGLSEYDARRPFVPTGTNLLGLVKHLASVEFGYFGATFGRPSPDEQPFDEADPNADMFARPEESREFIAGLYRKAWAHSDETIAALALDAAGRVPWWPAERAEVTLHHILVRAIDETARHAGQMDIIRELADGAAGLRPDRSNLAYDDQASWRAFHERVERAAREASGPPSG